MSELEVYLDREIVQARRSLLLTAIVCSMIVFGVLILARRSVDEAGKRLSSESIVNQVGDIADREVVGHQDEIREHMRRWIPQMLASGAQSVIDGSDLYRQKLEDRVAAALKPNAPKGQLDEVFAPIAMTRDRLKKLAAGGNDLLPFDRLTRRSIAVLLR